MPRYLVTYECKAYYVHEIDAVSRMDALIESKNSFSPPQMHSSMNGEIELDDNWQQVDIQESEE